MAVKSIQLGQVWRNDQSGQDFLVTKLYSEMFATFAMLRQANSNAANAETVRLLTQYTALQENQRTADQLALKDVLDTFDVRLASLRTELETVAVNTEGGFQATRQNLARLVSFQEPK